MQKSKDIVKAINRNVRSSPRKINLLLKNIRGKKVDVAIRDLSFARQRIAFDIKKTVQSAISNAENNNQYDIDNLYIKEAYVGKSIVLKRFRARAKGRASAIKKPYTNLTIILSENINKKKDLHGTKS
jgi:large subunit ribosomal protein L22|tara:strand:+ start:113 stop:496 length:384 start_codon:yes stop_codon:yes gene_type:complete